MPRNPLTASVAQLIRETAQELGIEVQSGVDAYGRKYLDISLAGLRHMHDIAVEMGHHEVASDLRQLMVIGEKRNFWPTENGNENGNEKETEE